MKARLRMGENIGIQLDLLRPGAGNLDRFTEFPNRNVKRRALFVDARQSDCYSVVGLGPRTLRRFPEPARATPRGRNGV